MASNSWFEVVTGGDSVNLVSQKAGIAQTTLNRQVKQGCLSPEVVVAVARAYNADAIAGLVGLGLISEDDVRFHAVVAGLSAATDAELAAEVVRRLAPGSSGPLSTPLESSHPAVQQVTRERRERGAE